LKEALFLERSNAAGVTTVARYKHRLWPVSAPPITGHKMMATHK